MLLRHALLAWLSCAAIDAQAQQVTVGPGLPLSGGTLTGPLILNQTLAVTGALTLSSTAHLTNTSSWQAETSSSNKSSLFVIGTHSGAPAAGSVTSHLNLIRLTDTIADSASGYTVNGFTIQQNFGGGSTTGGRQGLLIDLVKVGQTTGSASGGDYAVAAQFYAIMRFTDGGTDADITIGAKGHNIGFSGWARLEPGALNYYENTGAEIDVSNQTGSSSGVKTGIQIVQTADDQVAGFNGIDTALKISAQAGAAAPWNYGIVFGSPKAQWPMSSTGTLISGVTGNVAGVWPTASFGVDFQPVKFGTAAWRSLGALIDGGGAATVSQLTLGQMLVAAGTTGVTVSLPKQIAISATVAAGGSNYQVGDLITTVNGGVYEVATLSGSAVATVTLRVADAAASPGANPIATSAMNAQTFWTGGSGCTLNITWSSATPHLFLNADLQAGGSNTWSANGSVATALSSIGPTGAHTTVQEWLTVKNGSGVTRYIPAF